MRNRCEIAKSGYYQNFYCSNDFAKFARSVQNIIRICNVYLILRNCEISSVCYHGISSVQLILRNCEISSVYFQNFHCSVDFAELRNCKSVQFTIRISTVQLIFRNGEIAKSVHFTVIISTVQLIFRNQFNFLSEFVTFI